MNIKKPEIKIDDSSNKKLTKAIDRLNSLVDALNKKKLTEDVVDSTNQKIDDIIGFNGAEAELIKKLRKTYSTTLQEIEKKLKLVPKNHFRTRWLALGMSVFGIPIGVALSASSNNTSFIAVGIPIGMAIGIGIGTSMDADAAKKGKQLDL